ncbi:MAG: DUF1566 domain-containing protein [Candidatus Electrothrix sp. LOE1_4_5]|nr:DUF1566 domain-containing protein [Candidatus Electrothrix gigas]
MAVKIFCSSLSKLTAIALFSFLSTTTLFAANWNPLLDTGQTQCYDVSGNEITCPSEGEPLYGQDANYQGAEPSYKDNGDGTVTDNNTGLVWQQGAQYSYDSYYAWQGAVDYCDHLELAGISNWRLPTRMEFESILNYSKNFNNDIIGHVSVSSYWTKDVYADDSTLAWEKYNGISWAMEKSSTFLVRCVSGKISSFGPYSSDQDTVTDSATGLTWQKQIADTNNDGISDENDKVTWQDALSFCENLTLGSSSDWRLPNVHELHSIVDLSKVNPSSYDIFSDSSSYRYTWSSTTDPHFADGSSNYYNRALSINTSGNGKTDPVSKTNQELVRCVRGGLAPVDPVTLSVRFGGNGYGTVHLSPSDKDCTSYCQNNYLPGTEVTLTATADADSTFTGWDGPCEGTGTCTITINEAGSVLARFYRTHDVSVDVYSPVDYPSRGSSDWNAFLVRVDNLGAKTAENIQIDLTYSPNNSNGGSWGWGCGDIPRGITCDRVQEEYNHTRFTISMPSGEYFELKGRFTPDKDDQQPDALTVAVNATYSGDSNLTNNQDSKSLSSDPSQLVEPDSYALLLGANEDAANKNTIIFTHGWQSDDNIKGCDPSDSSELTACQADPTCLQQLLQCYSGKLWTGFNAGQAGSLAVNNQNTDLIPPNQIIDSLNVWQYVWSGAFTHSGMSRKGYIDARKNVFVASDILAERLIKRLGRNYDGKIHFIGHSLGTAVNAYAVKKIRHDMQNATVQMTILDHPNRVARIGTWVVWDDITVLFGGEKKYGFSKNFFVNLLPEINNPESRNKLLVDNYFSEYGDDTRSTGFQSAGVGTQVRGKNVYNHNVLHKHDNNWFIGLHDPNDVGGSFFPEEKSKLVFDNDHSGVHQWYRWTMWPVKTDNLVGNRFICHPLQKTTGWIRVAEDDWPNRTWPFSQFHESLEPCSSGFAFSIVQDNPLDFPAANGQNPSSFISPATNFRLLGSSENNCQLQESPFQIKCSKSWWQLSPMLNAESMSIAETSASNAPYIKSMINIDHTVNYMSMQYRFNNMSGTEFVHILIDGQIVWSITAENAEANIWIDSGKIPLFFEKGDHEFMVVFNGMETDTSTFEIKDLTFYKDPDADNFSWNMFMPAILAGANKHKCYPNLPAPVIAQTGIDNFESNGITYNRYEFTVVNNDQFPSSLFLPAPHLPPCGLNTEASRTWLDVYDNLDKRLYGFCGLEDLNSFNFSTPATEAPPAGIYIKVNDRQCNITYKSNVLTVQPAIN